MSEEKQVRIYKEFKVIGVLACPDEHVIVSLEPVEDETPTVEIKPMFKTEDERVGFEIGVSIMKGMMTFGPMGPGVPPGYGGQSSTMSHVFSIKMPVQDYATLGTPTVNQSIFLDLKATMKREDV